MGRRIALPAGDDVAIAAPLMLATGQWGSLPCEPQPPLQPSSPSMARGGAGPRLHYLMSMSHPFRSNLVFPCTLCTSHEYHQLSQGCNNRGHHQHVIAHAKAWPDDRSQLMAARAHPSVWNVRSSERSRRGRQLSLRHTSLHSTQQLHSNPSPV